MPNSKYVLNQKLPDIPYCLFYDRMGRYVPSHWHMEIEVVMCTEGTVKLEAPAYAELNVEQYDVVVDIGAGSGCIYLDDFDLVPAELADLPNPNAEQKQDVDGGKLELTPDAAPARQQAKSDPAQIVLIVSGVLTIAMACAAAVVVIIRRKRIL